jgi:hypothetical protein
MAAPNRTLPTRFSAAGLQRAHAPTARLATRARRAHGQPAQGTAGAGWTACKDESDLHRVRTGRQAARRDSDEGGEADLSSINKSSYGAANRRFQAGPPAKTPILIASGPPQAPVTGAAARQPDTDGARQAVPQPARWAGGSQCASRLPSVPKGANDRSRRSHRLTRHEDHRHYIGGLDEHVRPYERCEPTCSAYARGEERDSFLGPRAGRCRSPRQEEALPCR